MRIRGLIAVALLLALSGGIFGATVTSVLDTKWDGTRTFKLKAKGSDPVKEKQYSVSINFGSGRDWFTTDAVGRDLAGTWTRVGNTKLTMALDEGSLDRIRDRMRSDLGMVGGEFTLTKLKAKAVVKSQIAKLTFKLRFDWTDGEAVRRVRWSYKAHTLLVNSPGPGSGSGPTIVTQAWFDELNARMVVGRSSHTSTLLDDGTVLLAGGYGSGTIIYATAERFDPETNDFASVGSMDQARSNHTASRLPDGKVLVTGGERPGDFRSLTSAELFDPDSLGFRATRPMTEERTMHTATVLDDGRILVTGGRTIDSAGETIWHKSAEIFSPSGERWSFAANEMTMYRAGHKATLLESGLVLITGGSGTRVAEIFDPVTNRFREVADRMEEIRSLHGAIRMDGGVVLLTDGGAVRGEIFDPATETFAGTANSDSQLRWAAVTFEYSPGNVLIVGGIDFGASFLHGSVEQFIANYISGPRYFQISPFPGSGVYLKDSRAYSSWVELADGRFLITGGLGPAYDEPDLDTALIFTPQD